MAARPFTLVLVPLVLLLTMSGCAHSYAECFKGSVSEAEGRPVPVRSKGGLSGRSEFRTTTRCKCIDLPKVGTLAFVYERSTDPVLRQQAPANIEAYFLPGQFLADI